MDTGEHRLLAGLTSPQRDAVTTQASPLCIVAGAGSGKTRVLTRRIAWQVHQATVDPRRVLAVTFTRRAAREMRSRLRGLGLREDIRAGTFHSVALAQLRRYEADNALAPRRILDNKFGLIAELLNKQRTSVDHRTVARVVNEVDWCKARLVTPENYGAQARANRRRSPLSSAKRFAGVYEEYEAAKLRRRMLDFDDVLDTCRRLMLRREKHAEAQRWLHQHLLVDEFQDVNPLQFELLKSWLGPDSTLVVVGDPDQAIYGWNGADTQLIADVGEHFEGCSVVNLKTNFRSTPEILGAAGRVLGRDPQPAFRPSGIEPIVTKCRDTEEAATLARMVRERNRSGAPWRIQAVLARTNAQLVPLRKALMRQGIPVTVRGETDLIREPEIAALIEGLPGTARLADVIIDARMEMSQQDACQTADDYPYDDYPHNDYPPDNYPPDNYPHNGFYGTGISAQSGHNVVDPARAKITAFLDFAEDHLSLDPDSTMRSFLMDLRSGDRSFAFRDGVDLMTFHAAKGLEWPIVHLVGLEDGLVPIASAKTKQARDEEQRLLHVAVTRAVQELHVMWCTQRVIGDRLVHRRPSPWLKAITTPAVTSPPVNVPEAFARARAALKMAGSEPKQDKDPNHDLGQQNLPL